MTRFLVTIPAKMGYKPRNNRFRKSEDKSMFPVKSRGVGSFFAVLILMTVFLFFPQQAAFCSRIIVPQKACAANLRVLQGAMELYQMDTNRKPLSADETGLVKLLNDSGMIKSPLKCHGPNYLVYSFSVMKFIFGPSGPSTRTISVPVTGGVLEYRLKEGPEGLIPYCTAHGTVEEVEAQDKIFTREEEKRTMAYIGFLALVFVLAIVSLFIRRAAKKQ